MEGHDANHLTSFSACIAVAEWFACVEHGRYPLRGAGDFEESRGMNMGRVFSGRTGRKSGRPYGGALKMEIQKSGQLPTVSGGRWGRR